MNIADIKHTTGCPLAQMPGGDAFRANTIAAIRLKPDDIPLAADRALYSLYVELDSGECHCIASGLPLDEARRMSEKAVREVNACLGAGDSR